MLHSIVFLSSLNFSSVFPCDTYTCTHNTLPFSLSLFSVQIIEVFQVLSGITSSSHQSGFLDIISLDPTCVKEFSKYGQLHYHLANRFGSLFVFLCVFVCICVKCLSVSFRSCVCFSLMIFSPLCTYSLSLSLSHGTHKLTANLGFACDTIVSLCSSSHMYSYGVVAIGLFRAHPSKTLSETITGAKYAVVFCIVFMHDVYALYTRAVCFLSLSFRLQGTRCRERPCLFMVLASLRLCFMC